MFGLAFELTISSAVTASSLYLSRFLEAEPSRLTQSGNVIQPVYIDPSAQVDPSAKIGPMVAIGPGVKIEKGVRIKNAIVMEGTVLEEHSCVLNSIVGSDCHIGKWARVDGEPEPEQEVKGQISVTVLATEVSLGPEVLVRSCIVLPNVSEASPTAFSVLTSRKLLPETLPTRCSYRRYHDRFIHSISYYVRMLQQGGFIGNFTSPAADLWLRPNHPHRPREQPQQCLRQNRETFGAKSGRWLVERAQTLPATFRVWSAVARMKTGSRASACP